MWEFLCCSLFICLNLFWFRRYSSAFRVWQESHKSTQGWKISFWGSVREKVSVINKMNDFVGNILQNTFYACCYILLTGTHHKRRCTPICGAAMLLRCNWRRNVAALNCILKWIALTLSTLHTRNISCITLLWLHHNHKMSIRYHKNGLVTSHQTVGKWFIFICFVIRGFDESSWLSTAYLTLCHDGIRGWNHFAFMRIVFTFQRCFRSCGAGTIVCGKRYFD